MFYISVGRLEFNFNATPPTLEQVAESNKVLSMGGSYEPPDCIARSRVAIIVPHRARELHLRALLWHLHPIFQRQQLQYKVYVVHQVSKSNCRLYYFELMLDTVILKSSYLPK